MVHNHNILTIRGLKTYFYTPSGPVKAVDGVNLEIRKGEAVGLVGETGSGKSATALSIVKLLPHPGKIVGGEVYFEGENILTKTTKEMRMVRGARIGMIFQDPLTSLNPALKIGYQIAEPLMLHQGLNKSRALKRAVEMLKLVGIPEPEKRINQYQHELSGGMKQRVMIAMALTCNPSLLIADEPTTSLDVTIQVQILDLITQMRKKFGSSLLLITHNLGVVSEICDKVAVMYAGNIIEFGNVKSVLKHPKHPYTVGLLDSIPKKEEERDELPFIPGNVPRMIEPPSGCRFHPRCSFAEEVCSRVRPDLVEVESGQVAACHLYNGMIQAKPKRLN